MVSPIAEELVAKRIPYKFSEIKRTEEVDFTEKGMLKFLGAEIDDRYVGKVRELSLNPDAAKEM